MRRTTIIKDILLYLFMPEDTTETGRDIAQSPLLASRQYWLGPLKTVLWTIVAVVGPLLLCTLWA